eukprot:3288831-Pyramimonas_sp.AAC.1
MAPSRGNAVSLANFGMADAGREATAFASPSGNTLLKHNSAISCKGVRWGSCNNRPSCHARNN